MELDDANWRTWPPPGGSSSAAEPTAETPYEPTEHTTGSLADSAVSALGEWGDLSKTAAQEDTPAPSLDGIWRNRDAHPVVLLLMCIDRYGEEFVSWMPDTVKLTLERDNIAPSSATLTKIMAGKTLLASPSPWRQWEVFHWTALALAGVAPNFTFLEEPNLGHLMACADVMKILDRNRKTSTEVDKYVAAVLRNEGIHFAPPPLDFAQRELEQRKLQCAKCEAIHRDDNDTKCISCRSTSLSAVPYEFADSRDEAAKLWSARSGQPIERAVEDLPDTGVGNAVYRLLLAWEFARRARSQMLQQLRMIGGRR